jgi:hypothetical protein
MLIIHVVNIYRIQNPPGLGSFHQRVQQLGMKFYAYIVLL